MRGCPTSVTEITPGLLLKDAAYSAAAHVYYELSNYLSFKDWYVHHSHYSIGICSNDVLHSFSVLRSIIIIPLFFFLFILVVLHISYLQKVHAT